jgi:CxxC motif-containing protein (DUF1111 family)
MASGTRVRLIPAALVITVVLVVMVAGRVVQTATPAPAAFDNVTNGFEPQGSEVQRRTFLADKKAFDDTEQVFAKPAMDIKGGLGPVYNSTSCVACHQNAGFVVTPVMTTQKGSDALSGTSSQVSEIRAGHNEAGSTGEVLFKDAPGGSVIQQRAIDPRIQEHVPVGEDIRTLRMATSVLGDGFVESIPDLDIIRVRDAQPPEVRGVANIVPVVVDVARDAQRRPLLNASGQPRDFVFESRIGRFGWKSQEASLLNFSAGAYVAEMGITSPLQCFENTSLGRAVDAFDPVKDPEDPADFRVIPEVRFGEDVEAFARFMRSTKAPPQSDVMPVPDSVTQGKDIFENRIGCAVCHHPQFTTAPKDTRFGDLIVNDALANKTISPYSDFLLHDIGTGDGIVQTQYAELPPCPLTRSVLAARAVSGRGLLDVGVNVSIDVERLDALLRGEPDPHFRAESRGVSGMEREAPAIQVRDATKITSRRLTELQTPLRIGEGFQLPFLYTTSTANMIRTAPLWGLRTRPQLLHDGRALTLLDAIKAHRNQAEKSRSLFDALSDLDKQKVLDFLNFL